MQATRSDGSAIAFELFGDRAGAPLLLCHGLADSRRSGRILDTTGRNLGLLVIAPDRPGVGLSDARRLHRVVEWVEDAVAVLDALGLDAAAVMGVSGGGPFAAACAAALGSRVRGLVLVSSLGMVKWGTGGMAAGERLSLAVAQRLPGFGGWFLGRLAQLARRSPRLFIEVVTIELPDVDRDALRDGEERAVLIDSYREAFRRGSAGVAQDLRLLTRPWGFELGSIRVPTWVHHGEADTTVPPEHARRFAKAIPDARLRLHPNHGHFSLLPGVVHETLIDVRDL